MVELLRVSSAKGTDGAARAELLAPAVQALLEGKLVAFPTETVYGLGAAVDRREAVEAIYRAKGRPSGHPLIVHVADPAEIHRYGQNICEEAAALAKAFWPGPLTLIVPLNIENPEPGLPIATGGQATVGLRVPSHPVALDLLRLAGVGIAAPSANRFGGVSPTTARHVLDDLGSGDAAGLLAAVVDGGPATVGVESTIIEVVDDAVRLLRPGGISAVEVEAVIGRSVVDGRSGPARAPGMLASHYAPSASVQLMTAPELASVDLTTIAGLGVIAPFPVVHSPAWELPADAAGYAARLYASLREADRAGVTTLLVVPPSQGPLRDAVLDRLTKAAA